MIVGRRALDIAGFGALGWWVVAVYFGAPWALHPGGVTGAGLWGPALMIGARLMLGPRLRLPWAGRETHAAATEPLRVRLAAMLLTALALVLTELLFTRIFSVVLRYHFAFMAISVALLGLGIAGVAVYLLRDRLARVHTAVPIAWLAAGQAVATAAGLVALLQVRVAPKYSPENLVSLVRIYVLALTPMLLGGLIITLLLTFRARDVGRLYRYDLLGAAAAALLFVPFTQWLGAPTAMIVAAVIAAAAGVVMASGAGYRPGRAVASVVAGSLCVLALANAGGEVLELRRAKGRDQSKVIFSRWNSFSRVAVYERPHPAYGLSKSFDKSKLPESLFLDIDASASTPILKLETEVSALQHFDAVLTAYAYALRGEGEALVIGAGGGRDVLSALYHGFSRVDAVEINPIIVDDVMRGEFAQYSGNVYSLPGVHVHLDDGRGFAHRSRRRYDVIQMSLVDTWAATSSGAYILAENNLYTVEAMADYLEHLHPQGLLSIARWPQGGLRTLSLFAAACTHLGLGPPEQRAVVVRHDNLYAMLLKREPFDKEEVQALKRMAVADGFKVLHTPGRKGRTAASKLLHDPEGFIETSPNDVSPVSDDRPFFFNFTRLADVPAKLKRSRLLFGDGLSNLVTVLAVSSTLALLGIVLPMWIVRRRRTTPTRGRARRARTLLYFCCLGLGFIVVEIALMQKLTLLLGHPTLSLVVALGGLLLGSGLGAGFAGDSSTDAPARRATRATVLVSVAAVVLALGLGPLVASAMQAPLWIRLAAALGLVVPLGFAMGLPLPLGIRLLDRHADSRDLIPWAWGLNGALSVVGSSGALFIGMFFGFTTALFVAAATYAVATLCVLRLGVGELVEEPQSGLGGHAGDRERDRGDATSDADPA